MTKLLIPFLQEHGYPTTVDDVTDDHMADFLAWLRSRTSDKTRRKLSPTSIAMYDRCIRAFFAWAEKREYVEVSPMRNLKRPHVPRVQKPVHSEEDVRAILKQCAGRSFIDLRNNALVRLFYDSGLRLSNIADLKVADVNLDTCEIASLRLKGGDEHYGRFTPETAFALDEYLIARARHRHGHREELWLGQSGPLTDNGIRQVLRKLGGRAGVRTHPHLWRHTFFHKMREAGASDEIVLETGGWRSRAMADYYGAAGRKERAAEWYRQNAPGRRL